jgi:hypothetical protein
MSRYVTFGIHDVRSFFLRQGDVWEEGVQGRSEVVFDMTLADGIIVRVWTSVHTRSDLNAKKGDDAIRVCAVDTRNNRGYIAAARVYRVVNWRDNLTKRIEYVKGEALNRLRREGRLNSGARISA